MNFMNARTPHHVLAPKRLPLSDTFVLASFPLDSHKQIFFSDLRRRWEQIVSKGRS